MSRDKYGKWCKKWNLAIDGTSPIPDYVPKYDQNSLKMILECKKIYGQCSAIDIHRQILQEFKKRVSVKIIEKLKRENIHLFTSLSCAKQKHNLVGKYSLVKNVRDELITNDMFIERPGQVVGMDGTHFNKHKIAGEKADVVMEVGYDWFTKQTIAYQFNPTETGEIVLKTVKKISDYLRKKSFKNLIIQCDSNSMNCPQLVKNYKNRQDIFAISMSNTEFEHNPLTKSLNGWLKDNFYEKFTYRFQSWNEFF